MAATRTKSDAQDSLASPKRRVQVYSWRSKKPDLGFALKAKDWDADKLHVVLQGVIKQFYMVFSKEHDV